MPIDFRVSAIHLANFRGVRDFAMEFPVGSPAVVIGTNNSSKSTVLDAISLALAGPSSYNFTPEKFDFFHDATGNAAEAFEIAIRFSASQENYLPAVRGGIGNPVPVHGVAVKGSTDRAGQLRHGTTLLGSDGNGILLASGVPLKGAVKEAYKEHNISYSQRYARWSDINDHRPEVWLLRPDNLFVSLYQWKTGPLQRLAKLLASRFFDSKWDFEYQGKTRKMPDALKAAHQYLSAAVREFPFWKDDMKPKLQSTLSAYLGRQAKIELGPSIQKIEQWLADQLLVSFAADAGGAITPLEKMGQGWQSLVRIASLDVLSQYPDEVSSRVVLLFEEPESFLHPHLARKLRGVLEKLAAQGWTVVLTTHSPNLVSFAKAQRIVRLTRTGDNVTGHVLDASEVDGSAKFQERLDERGSHEMLFAQKIVLCEGQDDVFAVRSYLQNRSEIDLDGKSVSIVRAGDVHQLAGYASMASKLGIPWCALSDEDRLPDGTIKPATAKARERLKLSAVDIEIRWPIDLEHCLGKAQGKADPTWQSQEIDPKSTTELKEGRPDFCNTCEQIAAWVSR